MVSLRRRVASSMATATVGVGAIVTRFFLFLPSAAFPPRGSGGALCTGVAGLAPDRFDESVAEGCVIPVRPRVVQYGVGCSV